MVSEKKTALITGANSGLGFAAAKKLAEAGMKTVLLCRNEEKGEDALRLIAKEFPDSLLDLMLCDLSSLNSVDDFINKFKAKYSKIDILINNAAILKMKPGITKDGIETMFQTNYISPVIIMNSLLDLLMKSNSGRIINITAPSDKYCLDFDDLQSLKNYKPLVAFMRTKMCLLIYSYEFSRIISDKKVTVNCTSGGADKASGRLIKTNLRNELPAFLNWILNLTAISPEKCADTIMFLATSEKLKGKTGCIFDGITERISVSYWKKNENVIKLLLKETAACLKKINVFL
jgi:NAD(P)-dependent dehydrogenase (short-subunit alcohol dehydrogenase family)